MNGIERIAEAFQKAGKDSWAALMPYYTVGFPSMERSLTAIEAISKSGADLIELGIPFSDPLADGPTIQRSTQAALAAGASVGGCIEIVHRLRQRGVQTPLLFMGYINPILSFGIERFIQAAAEAGADGLIVPDLPPEEAGTLESSCRQHGLALVYLLSPASTPQRIRYIAERSTGFIYLVSVLGVTGERENLATNLERFVESVRACTSLPLAVGFGISTPEQVARVGRLADGVIVGSALINVASLTADPAVGCSEFVRLLRSALEVGQSV